MSVPDRACARWFLFLIVVAALLGGCLPVPTATIPGLSVPPATVTPTVQAQTANPPLTLFEAPRDGPAPVVDAIRNAKTRIDVQVYILTDPTIVSALIDARRSGRQVRVILNRNAFGGESPNAGTFEKLAAGGVAVRWADSRFTYTHSKMIVVDAGTETQRVLIMNHNLAPSYLGEPDPLGASLNFGVVDVTTGDVATAQAVFDADWEQRPFTLPPDTRLVISPDNSRVALVSEIARANRSIHFFAQEFTDTQVVGAMVDAARRGLDVKGILADNISGNTASVRALQMAGGEARYLTEPYQHAKAMIVDGSSVYIGSINFTKTSLDRNRELGILTHQPDIPSQMEDEFGRFWDKGGILKTP